MRTNWPSEDAVRWWAAAANRRRGVASTVAAISGCVMVETAARAVLNPYLSGELPFFLYLPGIVLVTAWFGWRAGLATMGLSLLLTWYLWLPPTLTWRKADTSAWLSLGFWSLISTFLLTAIALVRVLLRREISLATNLEEKSRLLEAEMEKRAASEKKIAAHTVELEREVAERTAMLEETIAELETFSYTVSHDLRSPARAMQGFAELVLIEYGDQLDAQARDYLQRIDHGAQRMDSLIREVLAYSRVGRMAMETNPVDLEKLLADTVRHEAPMKKINADIKLDRPLAPVIASPPALSQALVELLHNASKFVAPGAKSKIRIWTEETEGKVRLFIRDDGIGVPESALTHVFKPFHRAHPDDGYDGTGMGLAIVKRAIERQGGTVGVRSQVGQGSVFWLELPAAPRHPDALAA